MLGPRVSPNVFTIAAGENFAETLARGLIETLGDDPLALSDATIFLPTRRAVRTLSETFARILGGAALLPRLHPLGDVDEDTLLFDPAAESLSLRPAIAPIRRRLLLAHLVRRWSKARRGEDLSFAQATLLARALGHFLDEAQTQGADLSQLESLAPSALAEHWADVRDFLVFLREEWPTLLEAEGALEAAERRNLLLDALAEKISRDISRAPVIAAGTTGSIPATARLLKVIAGQPNGSVVLPGLDRDLDDDSWTALDPGHAQFGMKELLDRIGIARRDVRDWGPAEPQPRATLLREALRPAPTTDAWRAIADRGSATIERSLAKLSLVAAAHPGEEALAVALILREALETPGQTAALVTPDRTLARRVAAELKRWNVVIDDSAGTPLAHTPPGTFLLLLLEAVTGGFAPVPLLALLKHPLAACGLDPSDLRRIARILDKFGLRGPRPSPGLEGVRQAMTRAPHEKALLAAWFKKFSAAIAPLLDLLETVAVELPVFAEATARAAEAFAETDRESGDKRLWQGEAGTAAAELFSALQIEGRELPAVEPDSLLPFIRTLMEERAVRPLYGRHPRLQILGPLEARLQRFDVVVLGGLNEGVWPASVAADPWLSRPMRKALGFSSPERAIGLAAHDFAMLAAGPRVYLTRALKAEGAPTVASRWLQRLTQLVTGLGLGFAPAEQYLGYAAALEVPDRYVPVPRPAPTPPVAHRPRTLSITEIETWLRDPYAIYAKHILKLRPLDPLDAEVGPLERGTAIHRILELFLKDWTGAPEDAARLVAIADEVFAEAGLAPATLALWRPRFVKAARWFVDLERKRRRDIADVLVEIRGTRSFPAPAGDFLLRGRADRIDVLRAGGAAIIDYKTGNPPSPKQVEELIAPQLPLEGAILREGGFPGAGKLAPKNLIYIQFGGGARPGRIVEMPDRDDLVNEAEEKLIGRIAAFDHQATAYYPRVMPYRTDIEGDYDHLARVREWSVSGWQEDEE
ncbi:MAG TPA: double-strand break repair protein AddB [Rhizomicrobium sp.]|nr:double-strand break repair protein AddB [Rhizomicrobium sp.]